MNANLNFSPSSAIIPKKVLYEIQNDIISYKNKGYSVLELNYKNSDFLDLQENTYFLFKKLLKLSDDYEILYVNGGGSMHFSMIPLNFSDKNNFVTMINSDVWSKKAIEESKKYTDVFEIDAQSSKTIPTIKAKKDSKYLFLCTNNTSMGTRFPDSSIEYYETPLICDMTSNLLSENYTMDKFSLVFASCAKNMGTSGISVVIAKKDMLNKTKDNIPKILSYNAYYNSHNSFTTPNTFSIYMINKMLKYVDDIGGIGEMEKINKEKSDIIYDFLDESKLFYNDIEKDYRSITTIAFSIKKNKEKFLEEARKNNIYNLSDYNSDYIRIGLYNGVEKSNVKKLIEFMHKYEKNN